MTRDSQAVLFGVTIDYQLRYHEGLWQKLIDRGWDVHLASTPGRNLLKAASVGANIHKLRMAREPAPFGDAVALLRWIKLLRHTQPDVIVLGTPKASLLGLLAGSVCGIKQRIYEVHGLRLEGAKGVKKKMLSVIERMTCKLATTVVPVSRSLEQQLTERKLVKPSKIRVLGHGSPNGVDLGHFDDARKDHVARASMRRALSISPDARVITFVGRLNEDKGLRCLDESMRMLPRDTHFHLLIVGAIDDVAGQAAVNSLEQSGIPTSASGEVNDVAPYLAISDVLCLPSKREGLPTVVLEAFASNVPVVATRATGTIDVVRHGITGSLVEIDDASALADELESILKDTALGQRYAQNALDFVRNNYDRDFVQDQWTEYLGKFVTRVADPDSM